MKSLFVGNVSFQTTESDLQSVFEPYGEIVRIQIITDHETGRSRGFAFVEMSDEESAAKAMAALNGKELDGRALHVSEARPKPDRTGSRSMGRGFSRHGDYSGFGRQRREPRW